jgi:FlaG/FlaF family flagellin (archaellin)
LRLRKLRKNIKAISPVLSVLMMIAIAVAASLVAYAWVMGYLNFTTEKVGKAIQIQSVANSGADMLVYVQNVGDGAVELNPDAAVYVDGILMPCSVAPDEVLEEGETATLTVADVNVGSGTAVKVQTSDGTFTEMTNYGDGSGGTPTPTPTPEETIELHPNGWGTTELGAQGSYWNYQCVDDLGDGDGDSTYVYDTDQYSYDTDTYSTEDHGSVTGTINSVTVYIRCERSGSTACEGRAILRIGSMNYDNGDTFTLDSSWTLYSTTFDDNPAGGPWDWTAVDSLECGVSLQSGDTYGMTTSYARCTQVWVEVNYTP